MFKIGKLPCDFKSILPYNTFSSIFSDKVRFYVINKTYKLNGYEMDKNVYFPIYNINNLINIKSFYKEDLYCYNTSIHILYNNKIIKEEIYLDKENTNIYKYKLFEEDIKDNLF